MSKDMDIAAIVLGNDRLPLNEFSTEDWIKIIEGALQHFYARGSRLVRTLTQGIDDPGGWAGGGGARFLVSDDLLRAAMPPYINHGTLFMECVELDGRLPHRWDEVPKRQQVDGTEEVPDEFTKRHLLLKWQRADTKRTEDGFWYLYLLEVDWRPLIELGTPNDGSAWPRAYTYSAVGVSLKRADHDVLTQLLDELSAEFAIKFLQGLRNIQNHMTMDLKRSLDLSATCGHWLDSRLKLLTPW